MTQERRKEQSSGKSSPWISGECIAVETDAVKIYITQLEGIFQDTDSDWLPTGSRCAVSVRAVSSTNTEVYAQRIKKLICFLKIFFCLSFHAYDTHQATCLNKVLDLMLQDVMRDPDVWKFSPEYELNHYP